MQIERIEEMRITDADEIAIGTLLDAAFSTEFGGRSYYQQRHHVRFIVRDGAAVIGHMALGLRAIRMGDTLAQAAGLAEVATHPDHRGKGIATALMNAVLTEAKASPAHFLLLFGDEPLYAGVGFKVVPNTSLNVSFIGVKTGAHQTRKDDKLMMMPLRDLAWDEDAVIDLVGHAF